MDDILKNIDPEKRDRIINSAFEEFRINTFDKASTNNIIKNAGISKGLLFHYFTSKKKLYEYLKVFAFETMLNAVVQEIDWEEQDLFERIKQIVLIKFKVCLKYPHLLAFYKKVFFDTGAVDEVKKHLESNIPDLYSKIYHHNIDFTLFKEDVNVQKAIKITQWTMESLGEEWMAHSVPLNDDIDYDSFIQELDGYLKMLKETFYK